MVPGSRRSPRVLIYVPVSFRMVVRVLQSTCFVFPFETFGVLLGWWSAGERGLFFRLVRPARWKTSDTSTRCVLKRVTMCTKTKEKSLESSRVFFAVSLDRMEYGYEYGV